MTKDMAILIEDFALIISGLVCLILNLLGWFLYKSERIDNIPKWFPVNKIIKNNGNYSA